MADEQESRANRENRAARYRLLAKDAEQMAVKAASPGIHEEFMRLAAGWHKLADETAQNSGG